MSGSLENKSVLKEIAKGGLIGMSGSLFLKPVNLVTGIILARYLGVESFGLYSLGLSFVTILNVITNMGFNQAIVRFISVYKSQNRIPEIRGTFLSSITISLIFCLIVIIIILIFAEDLSLVFFDNLNLYPVLILFSLSIPFNSIYMFSASFALAYKRVKFQNFLVNILRPVSFLILIFLVIIFQSELNGALYANLFSVIITAFAGIWIVLKLFPESLFDFSKINIELKPILNFAIPTLFTGFTAIILMKTDRIMIGYFMQESDVGIYSAAASMAINLSVFLTPFATIFAPVSAELYHNAKISELKEAFRNITLWLLVFTLPIFYIFISFPGELLTIYGYEFIPGVQALLIIASSQLLNVATGPVGIILKMTGHQYIDLTISLIVFILNLALNYFLIPIWGINGAAMATAISIAVTHLVRLFYVKQKLNLFPYDLKTFKIIFLFVICTIIGFSITELISENLIFRIVKSVIILTAFFLCINYFIKDENDKYILGLIKKKLFRNSILKSHT
ncbi:MAG: flippase [Ignavibacteriaceae bacterium]